jgi:hypothetical protein|tara:strand:- start:116 stop:373 length:258 start_codon:yes stop_codon:yes gene_type:complete
LQDHNNPIKNIVFILRARSIAGSYLRSSINNRRYTNGTYENKKYPQRGSDRDLPTISHKDEGNANYMGMTDLYTALGRDMVKGFV